jgi:hypothetical protein
VTLIGPGQRLLAILLRSHSHRNDGSGARDIPRALIGITGIMNIAGSPFTLFALFYAQNVDLT